MTLSEKIVQDGRHPDYDVDVIRSWDVKEFIRDLKEFILCNIHNGNEVFIIRELYKLAGEELCN